MKSASDVLGVLVLSGLMGMIGQGARTIVGLKKLSDSTGDALSQADSFRASRIFVGLMIGFVAGVVAGLALKIDINTTFDVSLLLGLAAAGYAGTDLIEGFAATLGTTAPPSWSTPSAAPAGVLPIARPATFALPAVKPTGRLFGFEREYKEAGVYRGFIDQSAAAHGIASEIVYAVGSREAAWGLTLRPPGPGGTGDWAKRDGKLPPDGLGWGRGLMQADYAASEFAKTGSWRDPAANIEFGCNELGENLTYFRKAAFDDVDPLRAAIAAYNCGRGNVHKAIDEGRDVDHYTTGRDYSSDVLKRAAWFKDRIGGGTGVAAAA